MLTTFPKTHTAMILLANRLFLLCVSRRKEFCTGNWPTSTTELRPSKNTQGSHKQQTIQNQKQPRATHITKITKGNYNRRKENRITNSSILVHNNLCT
jgi:hypothetical protein